MQCSLSVNVMSIKISFNVKGPSPTESERCKVKGLTTYIDVHSGTKSWESVFFGQKQNSYLPAFTARKSFNRYNASTFGL